MKYFHNFLTGNFKTDEEYAFCSKRPGLSSFEALNVSFLGDSQRTAISVLLDFNIVNE